MIVVETMRICFVTDGSLGHFSVRAACCAADVICCSFQALGEVSYERELKGETGLFEDVAVLSKARKSVVMSGCFTDAHGIRRKSVVVADRGRILGVSDMVNRIDGCEYRAGAGIKLYDTAAGRLGVIVAEDLYFPRVPETLSLSGAEIVFCVFEQLGDGPERMLACSAAFLYGVPVVLCGYGYAMAADIGGKVRFASPRSPCVCELEREKEYHLVETRRRGLYRSAEKKY